MHILTNERSRTYSNVDTCFDDISIFQMIDYLKYLDNVYFVAHEPQI